MTGGLEHLWTKVKSYLETWITNKLGNFTNTGSIDNGLTIKTSWSVLEDYKIRVGDLDIVYSESSIITMTKVLGNALLVFAISLYNNNTFAGKIKTKNKYTMRYTLINSSIKTGTILKDASGWVAEDDGYKYSLTISGLSNVPTIFFLW